MEYSQTIEYRKNLLSEQLYAVLALPVKKFSEMSELRKQGLYIIYRGDEIIYSGKTTRNGRVRLREMISDYRSHSLNQKLLQERIENKLGRKFERFNKETKKYLIAQGILTDEQFREEQKDVNEFIQNECFFKFIEVEEDTLCSLEHYAIAILNPPYND